MDNLCFMVLFFSNFCINDNPRLTCLFETNKEVLDDTFVGKKDLTYSLWLNKREINLFVIPVFDSYPHPAKDFEWYYELWKELMKDDKINKEQIKVLKRIVTTFFLDWREKKKRKTAMLIQLILQLIYLRLILKLMELFILAQD